MDWATAIERHRQPLLAIVATLHAMIGLAEGGMIERLSWPIYRAVLAILRPAESAVRRLIVAAARGLVVKPRASRPLPAGLVSSGKGQGRVSFRLFDPYEREYTGNGYGRASAGGSIPRIRLLDVGLDPRIPLFRQPAPPPAPDPEPDDTVSAVPLCHRLAAIRHALKDLPRQARRYARWQAKPLEARRPRRDAVLRRGPPPGLRPKADHQVHAILSECHWLARQALVPDTS